MIFFIFHFSFKVKTIKIPCPDDERDNSHYDNLPTSISNLNSLSSFTYWGKLKFKYNLHFLVDFIKMYFFLSKFCSMTNRQILILILLTFFLRFFSGGFSKTE